MDQSSIAREEINRVLNLRHWVSSINGPRHECKCDECLAIKQVCHWARIGIDRKKEV